MSAMTFREMNVRVFSGEPLPHVFFQPRITSWIEFKRMQGGLDLPEDWKTRDMREIHRDLGVSMRYLMDYVPPESPIELHFDEAVEQTEEGDQRRRVRTTITPYGDLVEELHFTADGFWRGTEFMVKTAADLKPFRWLLDHMHYEFNTEKFELGSAYMGDLGEPQFYLPKSPYQAMLQSWSSLLPTTYLLMDEKEEMEAIFHQLDALSDMLFEQIADYGKVRIINVGENLHQSLMSPRILSSITFLFMRNDWLICTLRTSFAISMSMGTAKIFCPISIRCLLMDMKLLRRFRREMSPWKKYAMRSGIRCCWMEFQAFTSCRMYRGRN